MWLTRWFDQARQIRSLEERLSITEANLADVRWREKEQAKIILAERKKVDKYLLELSNVCGRVITGKAQNLFSEVKEEVTEPKREPEIYESYEIEKFEYFATEMREQDIASGKPNVPPLENYIAAIRENPSHYLRSIH